LKELYEKRETELIVIRKQRTDLLQDTNPDKAEKQILNVIEVSKKNLNSKELELARYLADIQNINKSIQDISKQVEVKTANLEILNIETLPKLQLIGYKTIIEAKSNILDSKTVNQIKIRSKELEEKKISMQQTLSDKEIELEEEKKKDVIEFKISELQAKQKQLIEEADNCLREIGIISNQLQNNELMKKEIATFQQKLEIQRKEYNRWFKLNSLIGDAEGKHFSKFAQELTLSQLISLANKHLKLLNDRYRIKKSIDNTIDDIIIIDLYQGSVERSVKTLSGGESFLLSLALALGLSDLAGKNTKIESLFIDEGFGSLDQETLDIALTALEKLQIETNRTIGIISHVESLKERIRTQIVLKKSSTGYSNFTIIPTIN